MGAGTVTPITFIVAALRATLDDLNSAHFAGDSLRYRVAKSQLEALFDEIEKHDGAKRKEAANDS